MSKTAEGISKEGAIFSQRLKMIIGERSKKVILELCRKKALELHTDERITAANLSQFLHGRVDRKGKQVYYIPRTEKLFLLAEALGVSPVWLLGLCPIEDKNATLVSMSQQALEVVNAANSDLVFDTIGGPFQRKKEALTKKLGTLEDEREKLQGVINAGNIPSMSDIFKNHIAEIDKKIEITNSQLKEIQQFQEKLKSNLEDALDIISSEYVYNKYPEE